MKIIVMDIYFVIDFVNYKTCLKTMFLIAQGAL